MKHQLHVFAALLTMFYGSMHGSDNNSTKKLWHKLKAELKPTFTTTTPLSCVNVELLSDVTPLILSHADTNTLLTLRLVCTSFSKGIWFCFENYISLDLATKKQNDEFVFSKNETHCICELLKRNILRVPKIHACCYTKEGFQLLCATLQHNSTLKTLDLGFNKISANGAKHLSDALTLNSTLTSLVLFNNNIGSDVAKHLSDALKLNSTLTILFLFNNKIGANGAEHLSDALKLNSTLTTLNLDCNNIGSNGAQRLSDVLKLNSTLTVLSLSDNNIDHALITAMRKIRSGLTILC